MLADLTALELGYLRMSVGYGTHKKGRPLSPVEVGKLIQRVKNRAFQQRIVLRLSILILQAFLGSYEFLNFLTIFNI